MGKYYYNLVEDEKEARKERLSTRFAMALIAFGIIVFGLNYLGKEKLT